MLSVNRAPLHDPHASLISLPRVEQRRKYPAELRVAISAADAEGIRPSVILRMVRSGELDGLSRPFQIKDSSFWAIKKQEKERRIAAVEPIQPGDEETAAGAILRRALEIAKREVQKIDAELNDPRKTASEKAALAKSLDIFSKMVRSYEHKAGTAKSNGKSQDRAGAASATRRSDPLSDLIRSKEKELTTA